MSLNTDFEIDFNDFPDLPEFQDDEIAPFSPPVESPPKRTTPATPTSWPPKLVFDLALGLDNSDEIAERYGLTEQTLEKFFTLPKFRQEVASLTRELRENNTIFLNKAKVQAETYLADMDDLMRDINTSPTVKLSIFQTLAKLADLEPKPDPVNPLGQFAPQQGGAMRMVVEWVGGPKDHSDLSDQQHMVIEAEN